MSNASLIISKFVPFNPCVGGIGYRFCQSSLSTVAALFCKPRIGNGCARFCLQFDAGITYSVCPSNNGSRLDRGPFRAENKLTVFKTPSFFSYSKSYITRTSGRSHFVRDRNFRRPTISLLGFERLHNLLRCASGTLLFNTSRF